MVGKSKKYLSATQLNMFLRCPQQYYFRYIEGLKIPPSGAMVQGRAWHEALEANYSQKINSDTDLPLDDMQDIFATRFEEAVEAEEIAFRANENPGGLKDQGVSIVETHHNAIAPEVHPVVVEEQFWISLGDDFPYELMGYWDLVDRNGIIIDNKAYSRKPSQADLDKNIQLTVYALGYRASQQKTEKKLRLDAIIKNKTPKAVQLETTRSNEDCRWLLGLIEKVAESIQTGVFYPNPTGWCCNKKYCGYWHICRTRKG